MLIGHIVSQLPRLLIIEAGEQIDSGGRYLMKQRREERQQLALKAFDFSWAWVT